VRPTRPERTVVAIRTLRVVACQRSGAVEALHVAALVGALSILCAYGIHLGRFGRWNSCDVVKRPARLVDGMQAAPDQPDFATFVAIFTVVVALDDSTAPRPGFACVFSDGGGLVAVVSTAGDDAASSNEPTRSRRRGCDGGRAAKNSIG